MKILVTGGAGFIGSHFIKRHLAHHLRDEIINLDSLTYAGNLANLAEVEKSPRYSFVKGDIRDLVRPEWQRALAEVSVIVHFAAETHVDRSLVFANDFIQTNIQGTFSLLEAARKAKVARFIHISTDEVYGPVPVGMTTEESRFDPSSPYAASKAAAEHMVMSFWHTYNYPVLITRCANNYGPYQYPEKFLPLCITNALEDKPLPIYGDGKNVRNWIDVRDHCQAIEDVLHGGRPGRAYNIAGQGDWSNIFIAKSILQYLGKPQSLIKYVEDRAGHDVRYAPDCSRIQEELGWQAESHFMLQLPALIEWYKANEAWWRPLKEAKNA